jgi:hypothetical protein
MLLGCTRFVGRVRDRRRRFNRTHRSGNVRTPLEAIDRDLYPFVYDHAQLGGIEV